MLEDAGGFSDRENMGLISSGDSYTSVHRGIKEISYERHIMLFCTVTVHVVWRKQIVFQHLRGLSAFNV